MMNNFNKLGKIITKILEVFHWVGVGIMIAAIICAIVSPDLVSKFVEFDVKENYGVDMSIYGFEVHTNLKDGAIDKLTFVLFGIGAVLILSLVAMIFRNLYLIIKKSENSTPFVKDNARMVKEIGIFSISIPIVGLIMSIIIRLAIGPDAVEISTNLSGIAMGIIVLCLTQFFIYGIKLEKDVDGLL